MGLSVAPYLLMRPRLRRGARDRSITRPRNDLGHRSIGTANSMALACDSCYYLINTSKPEFKGNHSAQMAFLISHCGRRLSQIFLCLVVWICVATLNTLATERPPVPLLDPAHAAHPPAIDGQLDDACWKTTERVSEFWNLDGSARFDKYWQAELAPPFAAMSEVPDGSLEVMWEGRDLIVRDGVFSDDFAPLSVHVYRRKVETSGE